jgi:DNA polymerase III epsilon subunit-like protein
VFDLEATGLNKRTDRIVAIALVRYEPVGTAEQVHYLLNPGVPIPEEATAIHGITDADVQDAPTFADMAEILERHFAGADLAGYNILGYDIQMLTEEFARANRPFVLDGRRILDAQRIFFRNEPRDLSAALRYYCGESHDASHDALGDVLATVRVLDGQFQRYPDCRRRWTPSTTTAIRATPPGSTAPAGSSGGRGKSSSTSASSRASPCATPSPTTPTSSPGCCAPTSPTTPSRSSATRSPANSPPPPA